MTEIPSYIERLYFEGEDYIIPSREAILNAILVADEIRSSSEIAAEDRLSIKRITIPSGSKLVDGSVIEDITGDGTDDNSIKYTIELLSENIIDPILPTSYQIILSMHTGGDSPIGFLDGKGTKSVIELEKPYGYPTFGLWGPSVFDNAPVPFPEMRISAGATANYVFEEYRGNGLGKNMMATFLRFCNTQGIDAIWIQKANDETVHQRAWGADPYQGSFYKQFMTQQQINQQRSLPLMHLQLPTTNFK